VRQRILIIDSDVWENKGGGGIILGMVNVLNDVLADPDITVHCNNPVECRQQLDWDVTFERCYPEYPGEFDDVVGVAKQAGTCLSEVALSRSGLSSASPPVSDYLEADVVFGAGGGYIGGYNRMTPLSLFRLWLASRLDTPVVIGPNTVEPFGPAWLEFASVPLLGSVDHIMSREQNTTAYLESLSLGDRVTPVPDAVFNMERDDSIDGSNILRAEGVPEEQCVGVTVRDWHFKRTDNPDERRRAYLEAIKDTIDYLATEHGYHVVLSQQEHRDLELSYTVAGMAETDQVTAMEGHYTPSEIVAVYAALDLLVGTRLHSVLMSFVAGTPAIDISYGTKGHGIMASIGMDDYVVDISTLSASELQEMVDTALRNSDQLVSEITDSVSAARAESKTEWTRILTDINDH